MPIARGPRLHPLRGWWMSAVTLQQMADRIAGLMEERLRVRGRGLTEKLRKGGRLLPRKVRAAAEVVAQAAVLSQNHKLLMQIDREAVAAAYDLCVRHLAGISLSERRKGLILNIAASITFSVLVVAVLLVAVLYWRGFL